MNRLNAKGRAFSWSYSSLADFEGCPARYAAKRYFCTTVEPPTEHTLWGERVHKAFEERIRDGKAFDPDMPPAYEVWARNLEKLPGEKFFERKFAVERNHHPCGFFDSGACGRGVVDLLVLTDDTAVIVDYKTGKQKTDQTQLELFAWFVVNEFDFDRKLKNFKYRYIWLKDNATTGGEKGYIDAKMVMNKMGPRIDAMERAWKNENFPMCPSGLCGWCPVEECPHWRPRR